MYLDEQTVKPVYTLGIASKLSGVPTHSIRQYIDKGLVLPFRTETNRHLFSDTDIQRLKSIKKYMDMGLNIAGLRMLYAQAHGTIISSCTPEKCYNCNVLDSPLIPCWITKRGQQKCNNKECRECEVYMIADPVEDMKKHFQKVKIN